MTPSEDLGILLQNRWRNKRPVVPVCPGALTMESTAPQSGVHLGPAASPGSGAPSHTGRALSDRRLRQPPPSPLLVPHQDN